MCRVRHIHARRTEKTGLAMRSRPGSETSKRLDRSVVAARTGESAYSALAEEAPAFPISHVPGVTASVKLVELAQGLYGLSIGEVGGTWRELAGTTVPATHITRLPDDGDAGVEVLGAPAGWLGPEGGAVAIRIPSDRGHVLITTYRLDDQAPVPLEIRIARIDQPAQKLAQSPSVWQATPASVERWGSHMPPAAAAAEIGLEIVLHIERIGDRRFTGGDWIGSLGQRRRIEAFGIRALEGLAPRDVEYKAYGPNGRETPWVTDAKLCGTRGRGMPLTGFAVRLAPHLSEQYDVIYEGAFFDSGVAGPKRNGEPCIPSRVDDPLEAVRIRLIEHGDA
jgi:hypothetical protein